MKKINILNINLIDWKTGSAKIMNSIANWINKDKFNTKNLVWYNFWNNKETISLYKANNSFLYKNFRYKWAVWFNFLFDFMTPWKIDLKYLQKQDYYKDLDIIHFHSIQWWYFDWNILPQLSKEKKVIMTLHDDWLISGNDNQNNLFPYKKINSYLKRKEIFINSNIFYTWVSNWISEKIKQDGILWKNQIETIYNWIDTEIFNKKDKKSSKEKFWFPRNKKIIISIAWSWNKSNLKWLEYVEKIAEKYKNDNYLFVTIWNHTENKQKDYFWELWLIDNNLMPDLFSSSELFLYPTLADSFWLVVAESLACNCPTLIFEIWWVPEILWENCWYIAKYKDEIDLEKWFDYIFENYNKLNPKLDNKFSDKYMVQKFEELYFKIKGW